MPNPQGEEFMIGQCPNQKTYDPTLPTPTWDDLLNLLVKEKINKMGILFCGKAGSDGKVGGTGWTITSRSSVQNVLIEHWHVGKEKLKDVSTNPANTAPFAQELMGLNVTPIHVTGIVVRKIT